MVEYPDLLKEFEKYIQRQGKSEKTSKEYCIDICLFLKYMKTRKKMVSQSTPLKSIQIKDIDIDFIKTIDLNDLYSFMDYLRNVRNVKEAGRARKVSSLKTFFNYLLKTEKIEKNPSLYLEKPKLPKVLPKFLNLEQSEKLLESVDCSNGRNKERDYCIITLLLNTGMRLSEIIQINVSDIKNDSIKIIGKGNKERNIYLNEACLCSIESYLKIRNKVKIKEKALFLNRDNERIGNQAIQLIVKKYIKQIGLDGITVHKLRHTYATLMYKHGKVDINILKELMGHESIATTQIYTHVVEDDKKEVVGNNPLSKIKRGEYNA